MSTAVYCTLFIVTVIFTCKAQLLPGGVPIFHAGYLGQPLNPHYQNVKVIPVIPSVSRRIPVAGSTLGTGRSLGILQLNPAAMHVSPLQLRSTDAKGNTKDQNDAITAHFENSKTADKLTSSAMDDKKVEAMLEEIKKESKKPAQHFKNVKEKRDEGKLADSIDPVNQQTDEIPKQVIGSSGSFPNSSKVSVKPKIRSSGNEEGIPDLDYLSRAANPIDDIEKKIETTAKHIGKGIKNTFKNITKFFQGRTEERHNDGSAKYSNKQYENSDMKQPVLSTGLKMAMDDFQRSLIKSQLMQKYYGNERTNGNYGNQYNSEIDARGRPANIEVNFWDSTGSGPKTADDSLIKGGQSKIKEIESKASLNSKQELPTNIFWNPENNAASNFVDAFKSSGIGYEMPNLKQNGAPDNFWRQFMVDYVNAYAKNFANSEQSTNNQFIGGPNKGEYGDGYRSYPGYYGNGPHGHKEHYAHNGHYSNHGSHGNQGYHIHGPYYPVSYHNAYYPTNGWQFGTGYHKRSPTEVKNSTVAKISQDSKKAENSTSARVAETVEDAGILFKRSDSVESEESSSLRSPRQILPLPILPLPVLMPSIQPGIAKTALNFAQGFIGANPSQGIMTPIIGGFGRSAGNLAQGLGLMHNHAYPIQALPLNQFEQTAGSAINLAQGIISNSPDQIATSGMRMGTGITGVSNGNQITNSALNLAQGILSGNPGQIADSGVNMGTNIAGTGLAMPRFFKRSDSTERKDAESTRILRQIPIWSQGWAQPASGITNTAMNLAQSILSGNPGQIANSGINMGTSIAGRANEGEITNSAMQTTKAIWNGNPERFVNSGVSIGTGITGRTNQAGITNSALNLAQGIWNENPEQIANSGVIMGTDIAGTRLAIPRFFKRSDLIEEKNATLTRILRQMSPWSQGWAHPANGITNSAINLAKSILGGNPVQIADSGINMGTGIAGRAHEAGIANSALNMAQDIWSDDRSQIVDSGRNTATGIAGRIDGARATTSALNMAQNIWSGNPRQIANSGINMGTGMADRAYGGGITNSALNMAQGIWSGNPGQIANSGVNMGAGIAGTGLATPHYFKRSNAADPKNATSIRIIRQMQPWNQGGYQPASEITNTAINLAQSILSGNPGQIANLGVDMGSDIVGSPHGGAVPNSTINPAQQIRSGNAPQIANPGVNIPNRFPQRPNGILNVNSETVMSLPMPGEYDNDDHIPNSGTVMDISYVYQPSGFILPPSNRPQGMMVGNSGQIVDPSVNRGSGNIHQPHGAIATNSASNPAQGIVNGNPGQISDASINIGTGVQAPANEAGFNGPRYLKRSPQEGVWRSAAGLAGSIADSASVDSSKLRSKEIMKSAVGVTKKGESVLPSDLIWESISNLAGNIAEVTEKPSVLSKALIPCNKPDKTIVKTPNHLSKASRSQILEATKPSGGIANSATTLASRIF